MNLPNSITMSRIVMIPLLLWILSPHFPWQDPAGSQEILASILFVLASITDGVLTVGEKLKSFIPLVNGLEVVHMPPLAFVQRPSRWLEAISRYRARTSGAPA